jgi:5-methyltetrahydropteroyltriglutamate--homocysteine methyltransferase
VTHLGIHLCRGNNAGMWMASGGYDYIAKALFERAAAFDAFLMEYDDARSGSFEPLAQAPDDKLLVLGPVSTKSPREETADELIARIEEAARSFAREQLGL